MAMKKSSATDFIGSMANNVLFGDSNIAPTKEEIEITEKSIGTECELSVSDLTTFKDHTFKVNDDAEMDALVDSIRENGMLLPILVREIDDGKYEIISGHRRKRAAEILGLEKVPAKILFNIDDDTATIMMVDTNLHREKLLPSEKAFSYKKRLEAMKRQGKRVGIELNEEETPLEALSRTAEDSQRNIRRYIKLTQLEEPLLKMVDSGEMPFIAGYGLAHMSKEAQTELVEALSKHPTSITLAKAEELRKAIPSKENYINILSGKKAQPKQNVKIKFEEKILTSVLPDKVKKEPIEKRIEFYKKALEYYIKHLEEAEEL